MNFLQKLVSGTVAKIKEKEVLSVIDSMLERVEKLKKGFHFDISDGFKKGVATTIMAAADEALEAGYIDKAIYDAVKNRVETWYSSEE